MRTRAPGSSHENCCFMGQFRKFMTIQPIFDATAAEAGARERFRPPAWEGVCSIVDHKPHPACAPAFSDALFACPERREPLVACWPAGLLPADVSGCQFLLSAALVHAPTAFVPAPTVRAPIPIASLAAAILRFLCVAVHSLGAHHAIAVEAARSCVSTREGLRKA